MAQEPEPLIEKQPSVAIRTAKVSEATQTIYSRPKVEQDGSDIKAERTITPEKLEVTATPKERTGAGSTTQSGPEITAASTEQPEATRQPEQLLSQKAEISLRPPQLEEMKPIAVQRLAGNQPEVQLTNGTLPNQITFTETAAPKETITKPKLTIPPNSLEYLRNTAAGDDPYPGVIGVSHGDVTVHQDGSFTIYSYPEDLNRAARTVHTQTAEIGALDMVG